MLSHAEANMVLYYALLPLAHQIMNFNEKYTMNIIKALLLLGLAGLLAGCKIGVIVTQGGDVQSQSGTNNCSAGNVCEIDVKNTNFTESFIAIPKEGYVFSHWYSGGGFLCTDSTDPTCFLSNVAVAGDAGFEAIVASEWMAYLMPVFTFVGIDTDGDGIKDHLDDDDDNDGFLDLYDLCPLDADTNCGIAEDIVIAAGQQWYQVDLFTNLSVTDIRAVCNPICSSGTLSGHEMEGWVFASREEVTDLVNNVKLIAGNDWAPYIFDTLGFRPLSVPTSLDRFIFGRTSSTRFDAVGAEFGYSADIWDFDSAGSDSFSTNGVNNVSVRQSSRGAWFYRTPQP